MAYASRKTKRCQCLPCLVDTAIPRSVRTIKCQWAGRYRPDTGLILSQELDKLEPSAQRDC